MEKSDGIFELVKKASEVLNAEFNIAPKGAPRIIIRLRDFKASAVFISRSNQWKLFYPFPAREQKRLYFSSFDELERYVDANR
jgi:hypothetical protein